MIKAIYSNICFFFFDLQPMEETWLILNRNMNVVIRDHMKRLSAIQAKKHQVVGVLDDIFISHTVKMLIGYIMLTIRLV